MIPVRYSYSSGYAELSALDTHLLTSAACCTCLLLFFNLCNRRNLWINDRL